MRRGSRRTPGQTPTDLKGKGDPAVLAKSKGTGKTGLPSAAQQLVRSGRRRATGADSDAVNANNSVANSAGSSADSSRATQPVKEEARVEEPRRRGGEVTSRRDKEKGGDGAARQRGSRKGGGHTTTLCIYGTHIVYGKSGAESLGGTSTRCQSKTFYINGSGTWTSNFRIIAEHSVELRLAYRYSVI